MDLKEAMEQRHTVRSYIDRPLPSEVIRLLAERIQKNNEAYRLHMQLITENIEAFGPLLRLILAKGVRNYIILSAPAGPTVEERLGYCGADVMLYAQTLGLNSWWVGGTFNKKGVQKNADSAGTEKIIGLIAIGYGATQGVPPQVQTSGGHQPLPWKSPGLVYRGCACRAPGANRTESAGLSD